ncbi:sulfur carrier protein ThiS [Jeotgalibacillus proteolyticus]|uniref:sulfur carrier protein ThiS n=1 Tax=Jeotgalibacillus proteolyticus TaxID=2082395 RepID=UPI003CEEAEBB
MKLIINGETVDVPDKISVVEELLHHYELMDRVVMVELNKEVIDHADHKTQAIGENDSIQLVQFVGGG